MLRHHPRDKIDSLRLKLARLRWIIEVSSGPLKSQHRMPIQNINEDEPGEKTQLRQTTRSVKSIQRERRPALVSLRGELMAVPIPLERDEVIIGRALDARCPPQRFPRLTSS